MLELAHLAEIDIVEVFLGIFFIIFSLAITVYIYKMKKSSFFVPGFALIILWSMVEILDEFFVKNITREIIFNVGGRIVLIIGLLFLIFALNKFLKLKNE